MFFRNRMPEVVSMRASDLDRPLALFAVPHRQLDPALHEILQDIRSVCSLFDMDARNASIDLLTFHEILLSISYRLLGFASLNESRQKLDIQAVLHVGMLVFTMSIFLQHDPAQIMDFSLVSECWKEAVDNNLDGHEGSFPLWLLLVGSVWTSHHAWLAPRLMSQARRLGLSAWEDIRRSVGNYPWLNALHDAPGRKLWDRAQSWP